MAYRQLCVVAFAVLGCVAAGCSGKTASLPPAPDDMGAVPGNGDAPPLSDDAPPNNGDAPPSSDGDPPPFDDGVAPGNGGQIVALCHQLCGRLSACQGDMGSLCESNCDLSNELLAALTQCQNDVVELWSCALGLPNLCDSDGSGAIDIEDTRCAPASERANDCFDEFDVDDDDQSGGNNNPPPPNACSVAGGCECPTQCLSCICEGDANTAECSNSCAQGL